jgi:hypothetical protein
VPGTVTWFSRKAIPADLREEYRAAYGVSQEERFRRDASMPVERAKQELREWDATISGRINSLRAARAGEGQSLSQREVHALAGEWYLWFVRQHEEEPGSAEQWDFERDRLEDAYGRFVSRNDLSDDNDDERMPSPVVRHHVRAVLAERERIPSFLAECAQNLSPPHTSSSWTQSSRSMWQRLRCSGVVQMVTIA